MSRTFALHNGSIALGSGGRPIEVEGADKASQDFLWALSTDPAPDDAPIPRRLYSGLRQIVGSIQDSAHSSTAVISLEVQSALDRLKAAQAENPSLSEDERIVDLRTLQVIPIDRVTLAVVIGVRLATGEGVRVGLRTSTQQQIQDPYGP